MSLESCQVPTEPECWICEKKPNGIGVSLNVQQKKQLRQKMAACNATNK